MEEIVKAALLGAVEGLTEFLPVSSTAHLMLANQVLGLGSGAFARLFEVVVQLGAVLAVAVVFWDRLVPFGQRRPGAPAPAEVWTLWGKMLLAFVPFGLGAWLFQDAVAQGLQTPWVMAATLIFYGIVFLFAEKLAPEPRFPGTQDLGWGLVLVLGAVQLLALVPGTSRSGVTILAALFLGVGRVAAVEFTFFVALPTMGAASGYSLLKYLKDSPAGLTGTEWGALAVGTAVAFLVALAVVRAFLRFIQKHSFVPFGIYRIALGLVLVLGGIGATLR